MENSDSKDAAYSNTPRCLICEQPLVVRLARGRRSNKTFVMMVCPEDGRHFRAFLNHAPYVKAMQELLGDLKVGTQ